MLNASLSEKTADDLSLVGKPIKVGSSFRLEKCQQRCVEAFLAVLEPGAPLSPA